jgi:RNA polymerase sigma-19 factor, ECF subfamily
VSYFQERVARDATLAVRVRTGDSDALTELYRIYWASLCRAAACMVGDEAPDVVQRVFFKVWLNRERWVVKTTVVAYLFKSVRNRALELRLQDEQRRCNERRYVQHARRTDGPDRREHEESPDWLAEIDEHLAMVFASGEACAMRGDVERALCNAVAAMSPRCRQVFTMYWEMQSGEALSYREIGLALGMSASTVRQHLIKAREILDEHLERAGWVNVLKRQAPRPPSDGRDAA